MDEEWLVGWYNPDRAWHDKHPTWLESALNYGQEKAAPAMWKGTGHGEKLHSWHQGQTQSRQLCFASHRRKMPASELCIPQSLPEKLLRVMQLYTPGN